jgi:hypothetical protein
MEMTMNNRQSGDGNGDGFITTVTTRDPNVFVSGDTSTTVTLENTRGRNDYTLRINPENRTARLEYGDAYSTAVEFSAAQALVDREGVNISEGDLMDLPSQDTPSRTVGGRSTDGRGSPN